MSSMHPKYEVVIGLEVHAQLLTRSKLFCGDSTSFGSEPNSQVSPITLGHPGTLPMMNRKAIEHAIRMGLVCHCDIQRFNYFARKNYFYPDLPKGYQVSQHTTPICSGGYITIVVNGMEKNIRLTRIHLEEDAGKSIHDLEEQYTCLDYNRAGTPLIEIVSEPDIRSSDEAFAFLTEIRKLVRWIGVCDGNMEEGSLRCDANISIRLHGENKLGTRVEVKNLNSVRNVKKAIEVEVKRLIGLVENGELIRQETRSFNADNDSTFSIRTKEDADDYRYFPEPDLTPFQFTEAFVETLRESLPALPEKLREKFISELGLTTYDAHVICEDKDLADYFQQSLAGNINPKALANWLIGPVKSLLNESGSEWSVVQILPETWLQLQQLVDDGKLSFSVAAHKLLPLLLDGKSRDPVQIATENNLLQDAVTDDIQQWVIEVLASMPDKVQEYRKGKKGLIGLFMGEVKKRSKGKADPKQTNDLLLEHLHKIQ
jgi:aspartyl-tRNA(Asn)/glutamyl-tRNA(Gln) amidotransferase subunit B